MRHSIPWEKHETEPRLGNNDDYPQLNDHDPRLCTLLQFPSNNTPSPSWVYWKFLQPSYLYFHLISISWAKIKFFKKNLIILIISFVWINLFLEMYQFLDRGIWKITNILLYEKYTRNDEKNSVHNFIFTRSQHSQATNLTYFKKKFYLQSIHPSSFLKMLQEISIIVYYLRTTQFSICHLLSLSLKSILRNHFIRLFSFIPSTRGNLSFKRPILGSRLIES